MGRQAPRSPSGRCAWRLIERQGSPAQRAQKAHGVPADDADAGLGYPPGGVGPARRRRSARTSSVNLRRGRQSRPKAAGFPRRTTVSVRPHDRAHAGRAKARHHASNARRAIHSLSSVPDTSAHCGRHGRQARMCSVYQAGPRRPEARLPAWRRGPSPFCRDRRVVPAPGPEASQALRRTRSRAWSNPLRSARLPCRQSRQPHAPRPSDAGQPQACGAERQQRRRLSSHLRPAVHQMRITHSSTALESSASH